MGGLMGGLMGGRKRESKRDKGKNETKCQSEIVKVTFWEKTKIPNISNQGCFD